MKRRPKPRKRSAPSQPKTVARQGAPNGLTVVFTEKQIQKRVKELASEINRDYQGKSLHVIGILENCFIFMADLLRALKVPVVCHFMKVETRDRPLAGKDVHELIHTPRVEVTGKDVLLVDGVLQSGVVQDHLYRYLLGQRPTSLRTVTLVEKSDERKVEVTTEYMGFKTSAHFLVGYGLGFEKQYRNLPYLASLP